MLEDADEWVENKDYASHGLKSKSAKQIGLNSCDRAAGTMLKRCRTWFARIGVKQYGIHGESFSRMRSRSAQ